MTLEKVAEMYGISLGKHLVSKRSIIPKQGPFKSIKTYKIELWDGKEHLLILEESITCSITESNKSIIIEEMENKFIQSMFNYYASK